jgi:RNA polymerase sigma-70 factor (ECF subfamily)
MNEHGAIAQLKRGGIDGLDMLMQLHQVRAVRTAFLITRDRALAEDVVQTAFVRVYERIDQFNLDRAFEPWFLRIVTNDAVKAAMRRERFVPLTAPGDVAQTLDDLFSTNQLGPDAAAEAAELQQAVWTALGHLPPEQRAVIVRRYYLDMSETEMADDLLVPHGTIKSRLRAARQWLRTLLSPWQITYEPTSTQPDAHAISDQPEATQ